ncbi:hypothetical protein ACFQ4J_06705 [Laceyella tengchongensis]|jgi:hypothetical protein
MLYEVWLRDRNLQRIHPIEDFVQLTLNMKFNDAGSWTCEMPLDSPDADRLIQARAQGGGLAGIIVTRSGQPIFSGPIRHVEVLENWDKRESDKYTFYGLDDTGLLLSRLAMPPNQKGEYQAGAGTGIGFDVYRGKAESGLIRLVKKNIAEEATSARRIPGLITAPDLARGKTVTLRSRYHPLIEKLKEGATAGGKLGFRVIQIDNGIIQFQVYQPEDKTSKVVFSRARGNLGGYRYMVEAAETNFAVVGGSGEGTSRYFEYTGDEPSRSLYGSWETFLDRRDTSDTEELTQAMVNHLEEKTEKTELEIRPLDIYPTRFLLEYNLGDRATVEVRKEKIQDIIRGVQIVLAKEGAKITPTVGTPGVGTRFRLFDQYRNLEARVGNLERR